MTIDLPNPAKSRIRAIWFAASFCAPASKFPCSRRVHFAIVGAAWNPAPPPVVVANGMSLCRSWVGVLDVFHADRREAVSMQVAPAQRY
jgi:hypothetical protein